MHHCLYIEEIICIIFSLSTKRDLVSLAATCKTFRDPALRILWRCLEDLSPLIRCLPVDIWIEEVVTPPEPPLQILGFIYEPTKLTMLVGDTHFTPPFRLTLFSVFETQARHHDRLVTTRILRTIYSVFQVLGHQDQFCCPSDRCRDFPRAGRIHPRETRLPQIEESYVGAL